MTEQERLRRFAEERRMTQKQMAEYLGISREALSRIIGGKQPISPKLQGRFFRAFGAEALNKVFDSDSAAEPAEATA